MRQNASSQNYNGLLSRSSYRHPYCVMPTSLIHSIISPLTSRYILPSSDRVLTDTILRSYKLLVPIERRLDFTKTITIPHVDHFQECQIEDYMENHEEYISVETSVYH